MRKVTLNGNSGDIIALEAGHASSFMLHGTHLTIWEMMHVSWKTILLSEYAKCKRFEEIQSE